TDIMGVNEQGGCELFTNNGNLPLPGFTKTQDFQDSALSGIRTDVNGDGLDDFALSTFGLAVVYINNPANPGQFTRFVLPHPASIMYDIETTDIDLHGDLDIVAASISGGNANDTARVWLNRGDGKTYDDFPNISDLLPGVAPYERLSFGPVDYDRDGDLDVFLTGSDGQGQWGFGCTADQFWENKLTGMDAAISGSCTGPITFRVCAAKATPY